MGRMQLTAGVGDCCWAVVVRLGLARTPIPPCEEASTWASYGQVISGIWRFDAATCDATQYMGSRWCRFWPVRGHELPLGRGGW